MNLQNWTLGFGFGKIKSEALREFRCFVQYSTMNNYIWVSRHPLTAISWLFLRTV